MSIAESLLPEFDEEMAATRRVLERVPDGRIDWTPHEKSMPLGRLASHVAEIPDWGANAVGQEGLSFDPATFVPRNLKTTAENLALFDGAVKAARAALAAAPDADFAKPWSLKMGDKVMFTHTRGAVYRRFCISHMVHHRAQLGVYLRLLGVALPGIYGPTADEKAMRR